MKLIKRERERRKRDDCSIFSLSCSVGDRNKYEIHLPLPPKIDPTVTMMQVEEKPDVTYNDVGMTSSAPLNMYC